MVVNMLCVTVLLFRREWNQGAAVYFCGLVWCNGSEYVVCDCAAVQTWVESRCSCLVFLMTSLRWVIVHICLLYVFYKPFVMQSWSGVEWWGHMTTSTYLRRDFRRSDNLNTFMFANNRDFGKLFMVKHKHDWVVFEEQLKQLRQLFRLCERKQISMCICIPRCMSVIDAVV